MNIEVLSVSELRSLKEKAEVLMKQKCDHSSGRRRYVEDEYGDGEYVHCSDCGQYLTFKNYPML